MHFADLDRAYEFDKKCIPDSIVAYPVQIALQDPIANDIMHKVAKYCESHDNTRDGSLGTR